MAADLQDQDRRASLIVTLTKGADRRPVWEAKWRTSDGRQAKKRLGLALLEPRVEEGDDTPFTARPRHDGWRQHWIVPTTPTGRPQRADGLLNHEQAVKLIGTTIEQHERDLAERDAAASIEARGGPTTFGQAADDWLVERAADVQDGHLKASSLRDYKSMLRRPDAVIARRGRRAAAWVMDEFGDRPIVEITASDIDEFERGLRSKKMASRTRVKYLTVLSMVFDFAVKRGDVAVNQVVVNRQQQPKRRRQAHKPALVMYGASVVEEIASEAEGQIGDIIRVAALTGLRQGELLALRWHDISFERRSITVKRTHVAGVGEDTPKSGKSRSVPLSDQAGAVLDRVSKRDQWVGAGDLVFGRQDGNGRPGKRFRAYVWLSLDDSTVRREFMRARDVVVGRHAKKGAHLPTLRFHDLRHCFGSACAAAGVPLSSIQAWMGHANISTTMIYVHHAPQHDDADRLSRAQARGTSAEIATAPIP